MNSPTVSNSSSSIERWGKSWVPVDNVSGVQQTNRGSDMANGRSNRIIHAPMRPCDVPCGCIGLY